MSADICNEFDRAKEYGFKSDWPNPASISSDNAILVLGAKPDENFYKRDFFTDERYYLLDNRKIKDDYEGDSSKFILCNFMDITETDSLSKVYCKKFNTIIFDFSVVKFISHYNFILKPIFNDLLKLLKNDGVLIIESTGTIESLNMSHINKSRNGRKDDFLLFIRSLGYPTEEVKLGELITRYPVANEVFSKTPIIEEKNIAPFFVVTKTRKSTGGKRKHSIKRKKSARRTRRK